MGGGVVVGVVIGVGLAVAVITVLILAAVGITSLSSLVPGT